MCRSRPSGSRVRSVVASTVIGFPHGGTTTETKVARRRSPAARSPRSRHGGQHRPCSGNWALRRRRYPRGVEAARSHGAITKVIFETGSASQRRSQDSPLRDLRRSRRGVRENEHRLRLRQRCRRRDAGHGRHGARHQTDAGHLWPQTQVKASGGIRNYADAAEFVQLGATRLGTSGTQAIAAGEHGQHAENTTSY